MTVSTALRCINYFKPDGEFVSELSQHILMEHHTCTAQTLKDYFYSCFPPSHRFIETAGICRVRFFRYVFEPDPEGTHAFVVPIIEQGATTNFAALDLRDNTKRLPYRPGAAHVGFHDAAEDARFDPSRRALIHNTNRSWLNSNCEGILPIDWSTTALEIKHEKLRLRCTSESEARAVRSKLEAALELPQISYSVVRVEQ